MCLSCWLNCYLCPNMCKTAFMENHSNIPGMPTPWESLLKRTSHSISQCSPHGFKWWCCILALWVLVDELQAKRVMMLNSCKWANADQARFMSQYRRVKEIMGQSWSVMAVQKNDTLLMCAFSHTSFCALFFFYSPFSQMANKVWLKLYLLWQRKI